MRVSVNSKAIEAVEYEPSTATLTIWFTSGKSYDYPGVPESLYEQLIAADSVGKFFNDHIRDQYGEP